MTGRGHRIRRLLLFILLPALLLDPGGGRGEAAEEPVRFVEEAAADSFGPMVYSFDTPTLKYTIEQFAMGGELCYLTRLWVKEPARQIRKKTAKWEKNLLYARDMARALPEAVLAVNGSGFVSPQYPEIPDNYPGESKDYFYTPLGSLTVTDGEVFRNLEGVPYYGLALTEDGLQMYTGEDNEAVLSEHPVQTWSFYTTCPMLRNNEDLLPAEWDFADQRASRTIIARLDRNNYLLLHVSSRRKGGLSLRRAVTFFQENYDRAEWVYNLDGGPSSTFLYKRKNGRWKAVYGGVKVTDILAFTE